MGRKDGEYPEKGWGIEREYTVRVFKYILQKNANIDLLDY